MRTKAKWCLLGSLIVLLVVPLLGCALLQPLTNPAALTRIQAITLIQIYGVPYIDDYYEKTVGEEEAQATGEIGYVTPVGHWEADYEDGGDWRIEGEVETNRWGNCLTIWILSEGTGEISLIGFDCD
jgi:hypothetical protein